MRRFLVACAVVAGAGGVAGFAIGGCSSAAFSAAICVGDAAACVRDAQAGTDGKLPPGSDSGEVPDTDAPAPSEGGNGGDADSTDGFTCNPTGDPAVESCVIDSAYGVFVAPMANGGVDALTSGTKAQPYATIGYALAHLKSKGRVYICSATYPETVTLSATQTASLYGGFTCPTAAGDAGGGWTYVAGTTAKVAPMAAGLALSIAGTTQALTVEAMEFDAQNGVAPGDSSIAALVSNGAAVTLNAVTLVAGSGVTGASGVPGVPGVPTPGNLNGNNAEAGDAGGPGTGGAQLTCSCSTGGTSTGGVGGDLSNLGQGGNGAVAQLPSAPPSATGLGSSELQCGSNINGANGSSAQPATAPDGPVPASLGSLDSLGWDPAAGQSGTIGAPGQGGGGGGGTLGGSGASSR